MTHADKVESQTTENKNELPGWEREFWKLLSPETVRLLKAELETRNTMETAMPIKLQFDHRHVTKAEAKQLAYYCADLVETMRREWPCPCGQDALKTAAKMLRETDLL